MVCKRRKAFIGTAISLGASIVGGIIGNSKKKKAEEAQKQYQMDINQANNATSAAKNLTDIRSNDYNNSLENRRLYTSSLFKKGGEIYIKPSKRGTFTDAAKKRGQSVQGFASKVLANEDNYSPAMVKKARFAKNSTKWHHLLGGVSSLFRYGGNSKFSKHPTKQNLGLESPNKTGKNSPTAYRSTSNASSMASLSSLRSDDKVVQRALESLTFFTPVKDQEDARTNYRTGGEVKSDTAARISKPIIIDTGDNRFNKRANTERQNAFNYALDKVRQGKSPNDFIYPGYSIKAINQLDSITGNPRTKITNLKSRGNRLREHYDPITNTIYRKPGLYNRVSLAEYSHAYRNSKSSELVSAVKDFVKHPYITPKGYNKLYNTKDTYEYDAHKIVEPVLKDFLKGRFPVDSLDIKINEKRKQLKNGGIASINPIIQEGGDAVKLKPNTFLLRGRKHRNGGIVIGKGRNSIEAEGGEVVKVDKNTMKILSTVPMANGESPAERVVKGENPDKVFQSQENFKNINNLSNNKFRYGGTNKRRNNSNRTNSIHPTFRSINSVSKEDRINTKAKTINGTTYDFDRIFPKKFNSNSSTKYSSNNYNDSVTNNYIDRNLETIQTTTNSITHTPISDMVTARSIPDVIGAFFGLAETGPKAFVQDYIKNKYYPNEESIIKVNSMEKSKDKFRYGGLKRRKAALGAKEIFNIAGDAFNVLSPLIGGNKTKRAINQMSAPSQPQQYQAARLRTNYNINPQLTDIRTSELDALSETNRNTASSVAAQARNMRIRNLGLSQRNQLRAQKENIKTQLVNQDAMNRQQVANQNIAQTNDWRNRVSQFVNDQIVSKANVDNQMIEGISSGIRDIQSRIDKNQQEKNALTAIMASNPEQVDLFMKKRKEYENLLDRNSSSLLRPYYLGGLKNKRKSKVR